MSKFNKVLVTSDFDESTMSWATAKFRWYVKSKDFGNATLQQWWQFSDGEGFWKDVEVVRETNE